MIAHMVFAALQCMTAKFYITPYPLKHSILNTLTAHGDNCLHLNENEGIPSVVHRPQNVCGKPMIIAFLKMVTYGETLKLHHLKESTVSICIRLVN